MNARSTSAPVVGARQPVVDSWLVAAALAVAIAYVRVIWFTPPEATQGLAQKIYYLHIPAALNAYIAFGVVAVTSVVYLWLRDPRADRVAESSAEVGLLFTTMVLTTGPIWGKPIWGTWWTWDARLTLTLFLWFVYASYLVLRGAVVEPDMRARYSAVLGILGALLIPFIHMSVYLFRTLHPLPVLASPDAITGLASGDPSRRSMSPEMLVTLLLALGAFTLLYVAFVRTRYRIAEAQDALDARTAVS